MWRNSRITRDPSGLVIVTAEAPQMASISLGIWVAVGGRHEPAALNGVAHFIEHMLFKGTTKRSSREISQAVEGIGGYLNAFTSEENTCYFSKALHERLPELLDVLMDMVLHPRNAAADLRLERDVIKEEMAMYFDEPQHLVQELINETMWPGHPLGRPLTGTNATLDAMRRRHLAGFMDQHYVAENLVIAAAGNLKHDDVVRAVRPYLPFFKRGKKASFEPMHSRQSSPAIRLFTKPTSQTQIALGIRTCARHDERRFALRLMNALLGENMSSRLFQELREIRGLAYNVQSSISFFHDVGSLDITAGLDAENLPKALKLILRELKRLASRPPGKKELEQARDYVLGQMQLSLENSENMMNWLGEQWLGFERLTTPEESARHLMAVKASQIQSAAKDFFKPERLNLAVVSPLKTARSFQRDFKL